MLYRLAHSKKFGAAYSSCRIHSALDALDALSPEVFEESSSRFPNIPVKPGIASRASW